MREHISQLPETAVLLLIDLQCAIDHPRWGPRCTPELESNVARLLAAWRKANRPLIHIRHQSKEPGSPYRPDQPLNRFKPEAMPLAREIVIDKRETSAFIGTGLKDRLRREGLNCLVAAGVLTNNSVEATVRMAGNLGFETYVVSDASAAVDTRLLDGRTVPAAEVHAMSLANMQGEYATVLSTQSVLLACAAQNIRCRHGSC